MSGDRSTVYISTYIERPISSAEVKALYDSEPWWPERTVSDIEQMLLENISVGAWDGRKLVGFCRSVGDGRFRAYVEDVLVLQSYRRSGIGTRLLGRLLEELEHIDVITLFCRPRLEPFYQKLDFKHFTKQIVMHRRNHG